MGFFFLWVMQNTVYLPRLLRFGWLKSRFMFYMYYVYKALSSWAMIPIKWNAVSILRYGCTTWTLTKQQLEKKLDGNYTRMLRAILNKSWRQHTTRHQLYGHQPPITKTIQVRWTRHAGHCWRSRDEPISDVLLWTPTYGRAKVGRPARTYIQQLCEDTRCGPEDLREAMNDREKWRERVRDIRACGMTWWWWWWWMIVFTLKYRQSFSSWFRMHLTLGLLGLEYHDGISWTGVRLLLKWVSCV